MKKPSVDVEEVARLFESIERAFPELAMRLDRQHPELDLSMDIPAQPGLLFDVNVNLQGDELHLGAGPLWLEWFPCTDAGVATRFGEAVHGLLSGTLRIVEHLRGSRVVKAELQGPVDRGWERLGISISLHLPVGPKSTRVLRNVRSSDAV